MATFSNVSGRRGDIVQLEVSEASIPLDAVLNRVHVLPADFGDIMIVGWEFLIASSSGAYVAVTPTPCIISRVLSSDGSTSSELIGREELMRFGANIDSTAGNNNLVVPVLCRKSERIAYLGPVLAGAGVTGTCVARVRGIRLFSS